MKRSPCLLVLFALVPRLASAQDDPAQSARRELVAQADAASQAGDHVRALELARRAATLRVTPSLTAFLAREHQHLDQRVEALDQARACLREVALDATLRNRETIVQVCETVRAEVEPRVGRLELRVAANAPAGLVVQVGGRAVLPALFGVATPVMPGAMRVVAEAPGHVRFEREVTATEGALTVVDVALSPEAPPPPPPPPPPAPVVVPPRVIPPVAAPQPTPSSPGVGPWVLGGAGVAGLALAGVFFGLAGSAQAERDAACPVPERCPNAAAGAVADARDDDYATRLTATNVALAVGAAALTGAVVWYVVARVTGSRATPTATASPHGFRLSF
jgi:hypothetical protein